jgi:NADPH:quinone reductase-like Zn-dependent oxidoreductase
LFPNAKEIIAICSSRSEEFAKSCGASRVIAYDKTPKWGKNLRNSVDLVIDLVGGSTAEKQGRISLKCGGKFITMVGPVQYIGDTRLTKLQGIALMFKMIGKLTSNCWRRNSWNFALLTEVKSAPIDLWEKLQEEKIFQPQIEKIIRFDDIDAIKNGIIHVSTHHSKGKVVIHIADQ